MAARRAPRPKNLPRAEPWMPPYWQPEDAYALQALLVGQASAEQQRRAVAFILHAICGVDDMAYRPEKPHDTAFAEGKRFVGNQIRKFQKLNIAAILGRGPTEQGTVTREPTE